VLLYVVEPARPIDSAVDWLAHARRVALDDVDDHPFVSFETIDDARAAECARVEGLTAARRVEGRAVEHKLVAAARDLVRVDDARVELQEVRVGVIESLGVHAGKFTI
jgi:hypothetical protein